MSAPLFLRLACGDTASPMLDMSTQQINGVDRERYGVWCAHGKHIMVVDPADSSDYPGCVPAEPWPCAECTLADLIRDQDEEAAAYEAERWRAAYGM